MALATICDTWERPMSDRDPAWLAGYRAAVEFVSAEVITLIAEPATMDEGQRLDFVTGFLVGARDARSADLEDALKAGQ